MSVASIWGGIFPFLHAFSISVCQVSDNGHSECCEVIPSRGFDSHFSCLAKPTSSHVLSFQGWAPRTPWCCVLYLGPVLSSFLMTTPRWFGEISCFWLPDPLALRIPNAHQHSFSSCCYRKWPQDSSITQAHTFSPKPCLFSVILHRNRCDFWFCFRSTGTWYIHGWAFIYSLPSSCSHLGDFRVFSKLPPAIQQVIFGSSTGYIYVCLR